MALVGGGVGGAGNPVGGSFTGPAQALEIIGDFCFAYSGIVPIANTEVTMLEFQSGNFIADAKIQFNYPVNVADDYEYTVEMNGTVVQKFVAGSGHTDFEATFPILLIIPPYTQVRCSARNTTDTSENDQIVGLTGRIYRTRD